MTLRVRAQSSTGDMTFGNGSANYLINSSAAVAQIVGSTLNLWLGQWFLNLSAGIPYTTQILGKHTQSLAQMVLSTAVLNVPGVISIGSLTLIVNSDVRSLTVTITDVRTQYGTIATITIGVSLNNGIVVQG